MWSTGNTTQDYFTTTRLLTTQPAMGDRNENETICEQHLRFFFWNYYLFSLDGAELISLPNMTAKWCVQSLMYKKSCLNFCHFPLFFFWIFHSSLIFCNFVPHLIPWHKSNSGTLSHLTPAAYTKLSGLHFAVPVRGPFDLRNEMVVAWPVQLATMSNCT